MDTRKALMDAGIASAEFDARELVCAAAGLSREEFIRDRAVAAPAEAARRVADLRARRAKGEPLAYVLGEWDFYGLNFRITPDVLIPRMDTEVLADWAVHVIRERAEGGFRFLDLCCGSGCIGAALASVFPGEPGRSPGRVGQGGGAGGRERPAAGPCRPGDRGDRRRVRAAGQAALGPVRRAGVQPALCDPGGDGKARPVRAGTMSPPGRSSAAPTACTSTGRSSRTGRAFCAPGGFLALECGWQQARELGRMLKRQGFTGIKIVEDTAGIQRVVSAFAPEKIRRETNEEK